MFEAIGFTVADLGIDQPASAFAEKVNDENHQQLEEKKPKTAFRKEGFVITQK